MSETKLLYLDDSYQTEFDAKVIEIVEVAQQIGEPGAQPELMIFVVLDKTLFYPRGGGQPTDTGSLAYSGDTADKGDTGDTGYTYTVLEVIKREGKILHKVNKAGLKLNDIVHGKIDWERRHMLMRMHTASHLLDAVLYRDGKILVTGNELGIEKSRIDFNMPEFNMDKVQEYVAQANKIINTDLPVKNYYLSREDAFKISGIVKLAGALPPDIPVLRITEIVTLDIQADGGTHVNSLKEIGKINILSIENKGKERKRICYTLSR